MKKRLLALILAAMMTALPACGSDGTPSATDTTAAPTVTTATPTTTPAETTLHDNVPADLRYDGKTITILQRTDFKGEMMAEELTGEVLNDAIVARNRTVEERFGVKLNFVDVEGTNMTFGIFHNAILNSINARNDDYQVVANYAYYGISLCLQGIYLNLNDVEYLDLAQPWWNQDYREEVELNGNLYCMVGDICTSAVDRMPVCFINRDLAKTYYPDIDFYDVVSAGKWTLEYQKQVAANAYRDLDGNGMILGNGEGDAWGLVLSRGAIPIDGLMAAFGVTITEKNAAGEIKLAIGNESNLEKVEAINDLYWRSEGAIAIGSYDATVKKFVDGESVFAYGIMEYAPDYFRDVDFTYGIMPLPKYNEAQDAYHTTPHDLYSTLSIPITVSDSDMVGAVLEAMACESYKNVRPALFENAYKLRYLEDQASAEMFDLIVNGAVYDFGYIYSNPIGNPTHLFRSHIVDKGTSLAAKVKMLGRPIETAFDKFVEEFVEVG